MTDELNKTLEEATKARDALMRDSRAGSGWIARHPMIALVTILVLGTGLAILAVKAFA